MDSMHAQWVALALYSSKVPSLILHSGYCYSVEFDMFCQYLQGFLLDFPVSSVSPKNMLVG